MREIAENKSIQILIENMLLYWVVSNHSTFHSIVNGLNLKQFHSSTKRCLISPCNYSQLENFSLYLRVSIKSSMLSLSLSLFSFQRLCFTFVDAKRNTHCFVLFVSLNSEGSYCCGLAHFWNSNFKNISSIFTKTIKSDYHFSFCFVLLFS
jgi:hypothetical protein